MRLIDADAFKSQIAGMVISNNYPANKANAWCELIDAQATAYDPDKVVDQLEKEFKRYYGENWNKAPYLVKAIEIVKGGGVDGN